jgi:hypothetical protein
MREGYVIDDGAEYYCGDVCLHENYLAHEWDEMYANGEGNSYWTTWEEETDLERAEVYPDGRSEEQKEYARGELEEMEGAVWALSKRMWSAPTTARFAFGGESFTLEERRALEVMRAELNAMHHRLHTMRAALERKAVTP